MGGGFPGGLVVETLPANAGDTGSIPAPGRSYRARGNRVPAPQATEAHESGACAPQEKLRRWAALN